MSRKKSACSPFYLRTLKSDFSNESLICSTMSLRQPPGLTGGKSKWSCWSSRNDQDTRPAVLVMTRMPLRAPERSIWENGLTLPVRYCICFRI